MWRASGMKCPVCLAPLRNRYDPASTGTQAVCDHSHSVEKALLKAGVSPDEALRRSMRGMMCGWCNHRVLTMLRDSPEMAQRTADYLREPPVLGRFM
jgi:hypothetical protein